ncbi:hypothetical protein B0T25DRAFT_516296 [Lasiosphaeria hispida]|uniref:DUF8021 domain-containing protein n=1 Tax=Lasiosphaeria hispida TaxID=260671 RepID=A0AAJ0HKS0_9PEZI|nr:hypothetical protein B0T25DRAFT_516296 [Lasiosphaeria hispida]
MLPTILLSSLSLASVALGHCSRSFLKQSSDAYVAAQAAGTPTLPRLADNFTYIENDKPLDIKSGVLSTPLKFNSNRSIHDTTQCATFTELIAADNPHPYVIHTRIVFNNAEKITLIDSVVTDGDDWAFNATGYVYWNSIETSWDPIAAGARDAREVVKAAGDAYFDRWNNVSVIIPMAVPCARLEGGAYTGRGNLTANTCDIGGFPSTIKVANRRYVVDEEMGVVSIFMGFPGLDRTYPERPMPDSHMFRVEKGLIRYIHTVSACHSYHCGMPQQDWE